MNSEMWIEAMQKEMGLRTSPRMSIDERIESLMRNYCIQIGHEASEDEILNLAALVLLRYAEHDRTPLDMLNQRQQQEQQEQQEQIQQPTHSYNLRPRN
jgi:hypothetical protein